MKNRVQLYALVVSAKRYALFNVEASGAVRIRKPSEHGLGHLLDPLGERGKALAGRTASSVRTWIHQVWLILIDRARGKRPRLPAWLKLPAVTRAAITTPELLERFGGRARDRWYSDRMKPFNFVLTAHFQYFGQSEDPTTGGVFDPSTCHLMAPFTSRPDEWLKADWIDRATGRRIPISTDANLSDPSVARVQSYGDVVDRYWGHVEAKSAAYDGRPCRPRTRGLLARRVVRPADYVYISKEARKLEDVQHGQVHRWTEVQDVFMDEEAEWTQRLLPRLLAMKRRDAAQLLGISERAVTKLRRRHTRPSPETRRILRDEHARNGSNG